jgi:hypothetical protein
MNPNFNRFKELVTHPLKYKLFLLRGLPAAFFVGLRVHELTEEKCVIKIKHSWFSKNPFRSMYFAAQAMAAEMSTGLLALGQIYKRQPAVSMLVIKMEVNYVKKATGMIYFSTEDGIAMANTINEAIQTKEGKTLIAKSIGKNENGEVVSEFLFTWSFKAKN